MAMKRVRNQIGRTLAGMGAATALILGTVTGASAVELVSIPIDGIVTGAEGDVILVASVRVPVEFVGQTCEIVGKTDNQESVHENNDLLIVNGGQTLVVPNFEDEGFIVHEAGEFEEMSPKIDVFVRLGPDGVSSGGFRVIVDCDKTPPTTPEPSTTTTEAPVTTESPVTEPPTTAPPEVDPQGPTTTEKSDVTTVPSTTQPPTTAAPTTAPPPKGPEASGTDVLPVTGATTLLVVALGVGLVSVGWATRKLADSRR